MIQLKTSIFIQLKTSIFIQLKTSIFIQLKTSIFIQLKTSIFIQLKKLYRYSIEKNSIFIQLKTSISGSQLRTLQSFEPCPTETADRHRRIVPHRPRHFLVRIHGSFGRNIWIRIMIMKQWISLYIYWKQICLKKFR